MLTEEQIIKKIKEYETMAKSAELIEAVVYLAKANALRTVLKGD